MTTICYNHTNNNNNNNNWVHFNSHENQCFEDDEEEALSLCDLPITSSDSQQEEPESTISKNVVENDQQDFEFGPCLANTAIRSQDNMCNADEVFFQGQLLPLRHSVSYEKVEEVLTRKINRSMSDPRTMIRSNNGYKPRVRNLFHSHPSPSPQIRSRNLSHSNPKSSSSSSLWSFLQVGLVKPQEIGLSDLKNRSKRFGSHNSNSSSNSSGTINSTTDQNQNQQNRTQNPKSRINNPNKNTKKKQRLFFGGCKCSADDSIERTIKEQVPKKKTTKEENMIQPTATTTLLQDHQAGKQTVSRHRTFEWLKQLSIAAAAAAPQSET